MNPVLPLVNAFFNVLADGISKAAEVLCPMDHTGVRRAQAQRDAAVCDAAEAAEDDEPTACVTPSTVIGCGNCDVQPWTVVLDDVTRFICAEHGVIGTSRVVGLQHAVSLGEVGDGFLATAPSPRRPVSHEGLAAHITAYFHGVRKSISMETADTIADSLLADYTITK